MKRHAEALFCVLILWALTSAQNLNYQPDPSWGAPEGAASRANPLASKPLAATGGKKLFLRNCAECHDKDGSGIVKKHAADLQLRTVQRQSDGTLFWKITNGNPDRGMPSFSKLPELERWQIILFLRTLTGIDKPTRVLSGETEIIAQAYALCSPVAQGSVRQWRPVGHHGCGAEIFSIRNGFPRGFP